MQGVSWPFREINYVNLHRWNLSSFYETYNTEVSYFNQPNLLNHYNKLFIPIGLKRSVSYQKKESRNMDCLFVLM